jgi:hypothetical protein
MIDAPHDNPRHTLANGFLCHCDPCHSPANAQSDKLADGARVATRARENEDRRRRSEFRTRSARPSNTADNSNEGSNLGFATAAQFFYMG